MSNDKIINNINDAVQEVRSSLTPYEIRYLKTIITSEILSIFLEISTYTTP